MEKINCSVPILTLNSEKYLEKCLESLKDFKDVFLLDGNSTDNTSAVAKKYGIKIYKQVETNEKNIKIDNFSSMRIKANNLAECDWILYLDSDEFIEKKLAEEIKEALYKADFKTIFYIQKKAIMGDKIIHHSFNYPSHSPKLFNKKSGVAWKKSKLVHEQLYIPDDIKSIKFNYCIYSYFPKSYQKCLEKDNYYLSLVRKKIFLGKRQKSKKSIIFRAFVINFLRAGNIIFKSIKVYTRYGFKHSLPPIHVYRYARYHIIISYYRLKQLF